MLSKEQYKLLKLLSKNPVEVEELTSRFGSVLHLDKLNLIEISTVKSQYEFKKYAIITESGKAFLDNHKRDLKMQVIPQIITTAIALAAFIKSFFG